MAIADYYYERGYYDLAETEYRRIVGRWPNIQEPHFKMGTMYYKRGNYDYALNAYNRVIEIDAELRPGAQGADQQGHPCLEDRQRAKRAWTRSMNLIQKALLMKPEDTEALFALGIIYMKKEMYDNAMDTFYQVVKGAAEDRSSSPTRTTISASAISRKRQYKKALQAFTRGIEEDPGSEELRMNRKAATQAYEAELGRD